MVARADLEVVLKATDRASPSIKNLQSTIIRFVGAVSAALAGLSAIAFPIKQAAEFEKALKNVQKTTGFLNADIKVLGDALSGLSKELVTPAVELAEIAAVAGQLGLGKEGAQGVVEFTKTVAIAAAALDLAAEAAATTGARIKNIFQLPLGQVENVFSGINELSNTTTASAEALIDVIQRLGATAGLAFQETAALAATAIDVGVSREVAGTSLGKVFQKLQTDTKEIAEALGVDLGTFIGQSAFERFQTFIQILSTQSEQLRAENIRNLIGSGRLFVTVDKFTKDAAKSGGRLAANIVVSNKAFDEGTSILTEYEIQTDALIPTLQILKNNFSALSREIGDTLIPKLTRIARDLVEFLDSDDAEAFAQNVGDAFKSVIEGVENFVKAIADLDVNWQNLLQVVKLFIGLQLAQLLFTITINTIRWAASLLLVGANLTGVTALFRGLGAASAAGLTRTGGALTTMSNLARKLGRLLLRIAGPVGLIVGVGFLVFKQLENAGIEIDDVFARVANFFGFVTDEQAKLAAGEKKRIREIKREAEEAASNIRAIEKSIVEKAFGDNTDVGITLDADGGLETFDEDVDKAVQGVARLTQGIEDVKQSIQRAADSNDQLNKKFALGRKIIRDNTFEIEKQAGQIIKSEGLSALLGVHEGSLRALRSQNKLLLAQDGLITSTIQKNLDEIARLEQVQKSFEQEKQQAAERLTTTFSDQQIEILELAGKVELARKKIADSTKKIADQEANLRESGGTSPQATLEQITAAQTAQDAIKLLRAEQDTAVESFKEFSAELKDIATNADAATTQLIQSAVDSFRKSGSANIEAFLTQTGQLKADAKELTTVFGDLEATTQTFGLRLASLNIQKEALENVAKSAKELAATAKGAFDNTGRTIRAFRSDVLDAVRELEVGLVERKFELKVENRAQEFEDSLVDIEERRAAIIEQFDNDINTERGKRNSSYLKNRKDDELESLNAEQKAVESARAFLEEKALRDRIDRLTKRSQEFVQAAKAAAEAGNVDEALGLSEAARDATKEIGGVIKELQLLEGVDPFGNSTFQVTEKQIQDLLKDLKETEAAVSKEIPGINTKLKDVTAGIATKLEAANAKVVLELAKLRVQLEIFNKRSPGLSAAVEAAALGFVAARASTGGGGGALGDAAQSARNLALAGQSVITGGDLAVIDNQVDAFNLDERSAREQAKQGIDLANIARNTANANKFTVDPATGIGVRFSDGFAKGGDVRGPGGPKSDSIMARLSAGEFVVNAATRKFFGSGFFHDLQAFAKSGGGLKLPGFATGGPVGLGSMFEPVVQVAGVGGAPVHIHLPGGDTMRLQEGEDTVSTVKTMMNREARKRGRRLR